VCSVLEDRLARCIRVREDRGIDVNHDLVPLVRCAGIHAAVKRRLRDEGQRVGLLLRHGGRFLGNVLVGPPVLIQRVAGRGQRLNKHGANLRREPPADDDHTVFVWIHMQRAAGVAPRRLPRFGLSIDPAPAAHDALDVLGGAGPADREQPLLGLRRGDARERPNLGVRQLAASECLRQTGQCTERPGHPDALARCARVEPDTPRQPGGAREEARVPASAGIEIADEVEQVRGRGVEVGGQFGDLVAEPVELDYGLRRWDKLGSVDLHRPSSMTLRRIYTPIFGPPRTLQDTRSLDDRCFLIRPADAAIAASVRPAGSAFSDGVKGILRSRA